MGWFFNKRNKEFYDDKTETSEKYEVSDIEFEIIVMHVAQKIRRLKVTNIAKKSIYCNVDSNTGLSTWNFRIDFFTTSQNDYRYYIDKDNDNSNLPDFFASQILQFLNRRTQVKSSDLDIDTKGQFCYKCGNKLLVDDLYCTNCGSKSKLFDDKILLLKIEREKTIQEKYKIEREISADNLKVIQEKTKQNELAAEEIKNKRAFFIVMSKIFAPSIVVIIIFFTLYSSSQELFSKQQHQKNGDIQLPFSSVDFDNQTDENQKQPKKYKSVKKDFENLGFKNIELIKEKDVGFFTNNGKDDHIISVTINGDNDFEEGEWFPKDSKIKIVYHAKK